MINFELVSIIDDQLDLDEEFELPTYVFNLERDRGDPRRSDLADGARASATSSRFR